MRLQCIFDIEKNAKLQTEYKKIYKDLKEKFGEGEFKRFDKYKKLFENYSDESKYARNIHTGKIKEGIVLTELELSMICDDGFYYFGGSSIIHSDGSFEVNIYTD